MPLDSRVEVKLVPAIDEDLLLSDFWSEFVQCLETHGVSITIEVKQDIPERPPPRLLTTEQIQYFRSELPIQILAAIGPMLGTAIGAWLQGRYGRKTRLKIGDIEAEARTREEVEELIARAKEVQRSNQPKKIHEP